MFAIVLHLLLLLVFLRSPVAFAAESGYPQKPVRFIVGFAPGGSNDIVARIIGQRLAEDWRVPVVIDNRPGAAGNIAAELAARSQPDGYTLHLIGANNTISAALSDKLPYDIIKDFSHIILAVSVPLILVVHPALNIRTVSDLINTAKAKPGGLNYASSGTGSISHMAAELFKSLTGTQITHVPYKGSAPGEADLMAGRVHVLFTGLAHTMPLIRAGRLTGVAVTGAQRVSIAPDVPTVSEAGVPGYESSTWYGVVAPARTPPIVLARINAGINRVLQAKEIQESLMRQGLEPKGGTAAQFTQQVNAEMQKWKRVVKDARLKVDE